MCKFFTWFPSLPGPKLTPIEWFNIEISTSFVFLYFLFANSSLSIHKKSHNCNICAVSITICSFKKWKEYCFNVEISYFIQHRFCIQQYIYLYIVRSKKCMIFMCSLPSLFSSKSFKRVFADFFDLFISFRWDIISSFLKKLKIQLS